MKKILLGTTALVAATMIAAPGAQAAEPVKIGLGGFMVQTFGYADQESAYETAAGADYATWDQKQTSEVHFKGSTKLDNGIGVAVQLEHNMDGGGNSAVDEVYLNLTSASLGTLVLGQQDGAIDLKSHRAPASGAITVNGGEVRPNAFIVAPAAVTNVSTRADEQNDNKITYLTPTFMGFSAGVSFNPDGSGANRAGQPNATGTAMSYVVAYDESLAGVKVGADVGYYHDHNDGSDSQGQRVIRGGLSLGYAGFTVGGSYARWLENNTQDAAAAQALTDGHHWDIGVSYATGPYKVGVVHKVSEMEGSSLTAGDDEVTWTVIGGTYTLGPGVSLAGDIMFADYDEETAAAANNNDGWGANASVVVSF